MLGRMGYINKTINVGNGYVTLRDYMGDDVDVANVARVSFDNETDWEPDGSLSKRDEKLIRYLAKNEHTSPFRHQFISFRIHIPLFVAAQWGKHQVGCAWNQVSGRYVEFSPEFWEIESFRSAPEKSVKQGSGDDLPEDVQIAAKEEYDKAIRCAYESYLSLLDMGVCREQARIILPHGLMTTCIWTGSLQAVCHFLELRLDAHAQKEIQQYAHAIQHLIEPLFPASVRNLVCIN